MKYSRLVIRYLLVLATLGLTGLVNAEQQIYNINLPAQTVAQSLNALSQQTDIPVLFPYKLAEVQTANPIAGRYTLQQAVAIVLSGTGLSGGLSDKGVLMISHAESDTKNHGREAMKGNRKQLLATFIAVFGAGAGSSGVVAQGGNDAAADQRQLDEIIVTAQKREQNIQDVPMGITAMSGDELSSRGIDSILDLATSVPGLDVQENGFQRRIHLRGMGNTAGNEALVGTYLDEVGMTTDTDEALAVPIYDLERVEVLKGPQGTLYGAGALGGTIRFITKDPVLDSFNGKADISTSFVKGGDPDYEVKGAVNIPLIEDELALRIAGVYSKAGGWMDQPALSRENINDPELASLRIKTLWRPTESFEAKLMAVIHRNNAGAPTAALDENGDYTQSTIAPLTTPSLEDDYELYNLSLSQDFNGMNFLSSTSYIEATRTTENFGRPLSLFPAPAPPISLLVDVVKDFVIFTQEIRLASDNSGPLSWLVGGYYRDAEIKGDALTQLDFGSGMPPFAQSPFLNDQFSDSWAVFGDISYGLTDRLSVGVGLRYFEDDREAVVNGVAQAETFDAVSPRFYGSYELTDAINLYTNIAKGFRSGGFNGFGQPAYEPESAWSYEIGSKMQLWDGMLSTDLALFYTEFSDYQGTGIFPPPALPNAFTNNGGEAEVIGVEWAILWSPVEQLTLGFNGTYVNAEVTKQSALPGSTNVNVGDELNLIPDYSFSLSADYEFNWSNTIPGFARLDYSQTGHSYNRFRNIGPQLEGRSDIINMLNARIGATKDDWRFELFAQNLLDENGSIDAFEGIGLGSRPQPRTVGVSVGRDF